MCCILEQGRELTVIGAGHREVGAAGIIHWRREREEESLSKVATDRDQSKKNHQTVGGEGGEREGGREGERERGRTGGRERER